MLESINCYEFTSCSTSIDHEDKCDAHFIILVSLVYPIPRIILRGLGRM